MQTVEILQLGTLWPDPGYSESALLAISEAELEERLCTKLARGVEEGLGAWAAVGLRLASGQLVELVNYEERPGESAFVVRTQATASPEAVLRELLACLCFPQSSIIWRSGSAPA